MTAPPASLLARAARRLEVSIPEARRMAEAILDEVPDCRFEVALAFLAGEVPCAACMLRDEDSRTVH